MLVVDWNRFNNKYTTNYWVIATGVVKMRITCKNETTDWLQLCGSLINCFESWLFEGSIQIRYNNEFQMFHHFQIKSH